MSTYELAGIHDVDEFYADKLVGGSSAGLELDRSLDGFDIRHSKALWFYHNIRAGSKVLDFGCGGGALAVLKRKNCKLYGVELSETGARAAEAAGYDKVFIGHVEDIDWGDLAFDYIVSLDVFGHIEFEAKDAVIASLRHLLKPNGVMLHGIESGQVDYGAMSEEELRRYVHVDGRVGIESRNRVLRRFRKSFDYVDGELRFCHAKPLEDLLKEQKQYGEGSHRDLVERLESYDENERQAFDTAMGLVFRSLEDYAIPSSNEARGLMMLRASNKPLPARRKYKSAYACSASARSPSAREARRLSSIG